METWEQILVGLFAIFILVFLLPGVRATLEKSKQAEKDWPGLLIPMAFVIGLVIFVIFILRS